MKKEYITNLWMQGLLMATVVTGAMSIVDPALAQLNSTVNQTNTQVFNPIFQVLTWGCYLIALILGIGGIMGFKAHADNPSNTPLHRPLTKLGAGAVLGAIPTLLQMLSTTGNQTIQGSFTPQTFNPL